MYKIEQHGKISLRRPKLSKEEVKRLMKKKTCNIIHRQENECAARVGLNAELRWKFALSGWGLDTFHPHSRMATHFTDWGMSFLLY